MRLTPAQQRTISELASRAAEGQLDAGGLAQLEECLRGSAEARAYYVRFMAVSGELAWAGRGGVSLPEPLPGPTKSWRHTWGQVWAAAAVLVLAVFGAWMMFPKPPPPSRDDAGVATLTNAINLEWDQSQEPRHVRNVFKPGWLRVRSGLAQIEFISGTSVWLEGPAAFRLDSAKQGFLESGKLIAEVPHGSDGFRVELPFGSVVDRGTAFGIDVRSGAATVHVMEGSVIVAPNSGTATTYVAGQAVTLDEHGTIHVAMADMRAFDYAGYGWGGGTFGPLNQGFGPGHGPRHGPAGPWDPAWGPQVWKGYDPLEAIRTQLGIDGHRWEAIRPVLGTYIDAQWELKCLGFVPDINDYSSAAWDLWFGTQKPDITDEDMALRLSAYREARQEVRWKRDQAEHELQELLLLREEAQLVDMGYMR